MLSIALIGATPEPSLRRARCSSSCVAPAQVAATYSTSNTAKKRGTKLSVRSFMRVLAWNKPISRLAITAPARNGVASVSVSSSISRAAATISTVFT